MSELSSIESLVWLKRALPILLLAIFWCWESHFPYFGQPQGRLRHALRNLAIALFNTVILGVFALAADAGDAVASDPAASAVRTSAASGADRKRRMEISLE